MHSAGLSQPATQAFWGIQQNIKQLYMKKIISYIIRSYFHILLMAGPILHAK